MLMQHLALAASGDTTVDVLDSGMGVASRRATPIFELRTFVTTLPHLTVHRRQFGLLPIDLATRGNFYRKFAIGLFCRIMGRLHVVHGHAGDIVEYILNWPRHLHAMQQRLVSTGRSVIALRWTWRPVLSDLWALADDQVCIACNAIPEVEGRTDEPLTNDVVFAGRLEPDAGAPELLDALQLMPPDIKVRLTIIGSVTSTTIRRRIPRLSQSPPHEISVTGGVDQTQVRPHSRGAGISVHPSHDEGLPRALSAMASGQAPVVTPIGAIPKVIVDGNNEFIVPVRDPPQSARALTWLLEDANLGNDLGRTAGRTWRRTFDQGDRRPSKTPRHRIALGDPRRSPERGRVDHEEHFPALDPSALRRLHD